MTTQSRHRAGPRLVNGKVVIKKPKPSYTEAFKPKYPAIFIPRTRFEAIVQACTLTMTMAKRIDPRGARIFTAASIAPDFQVMAWEVRAAIARACKREVYVKGWEELTPPEGTPGLKNGPVEPTWQRNPERRRREREKQRAAEAAAES